MARTIDNLKISVSGIRGVVGETLTPQLISSFAAAFGQYVGAGPVVVGRDTRPTGPLVEQAVVAGLLSVGCQPLFAGIVPTPTVQVLVDQWHAAGGIAVSASHNPMPWNALKLIGGSGMFLNAVEAGQLLDLYNQDDAPTVAEADLKRPVILDEPMAEHQRRVFSQIDVDAIRRANLRVAMDCCNGAGAPYAVRFLEALGCEVEALFEQTDGVFRRRPEPIPANLGELIARVQDKRCDIGFALDPDADRLVVVDNLGRAPGENYTLALAAEQVLRRSPGPVTINLATSRVVQKIAAKRGCDVHFTKIGEIHVSTAMLENGSVIGGESNGGVIWPAVHPCRDSFAGMGLILEHLAVTGQSSAACIDALPQYLSGTRKVVVSGSVGSEVMRRLLDRYREQNPITLDGVCLTYEDSWVLARPSNTEPIIRIQAEAPTQAELDALLDRLAMECSELAAK